MKCITFILLAITFSSNAGVIRKDKYMHLAATTAISAALKFNGYSEKEAYDKFSGKGNAEVGDMVANAIGAYIGSKSNFTLEVARDQFETIKAINYTWSF